MFMSFYSNTILYHDVTDIIIPLWLDDCTSEWKKESFKCVGKSK
jgi:hypothetical protein